MTMRDNTGRGAAGGDVQDKQTDLTAGSVPRPWFWVGLAAVIGLVLYVLWQLPTPGVRG